MLTGIEQIEQFIETLFPSQDVNKLKAIQDAQGQDTSAQSDNWEALMLVAAVVFVLLFVSGLMVGYTSTSLRVWRI